MVTEFSSIWFQELWGTVSSKEKFGNVHSRQAAAVASWSCKKNLRKNTEPKQNNDMIYDAS